MTWRTWLYVAAPPPGRPGAGANRDYTSRLANERHVIVHTYFVNNDPPIPYAQAGSVQSGDRIVLAFSEGQRQTVIGVYVAVEASDIGRQAVISLGSLRNTRHEPSGAWIRVPDDWVEGMEYPQDPYLHCYCGIAVQRLQGARVTGEILQVALENRIDSSHALNPWGINSEPIMPGTE